MAQQILREDEDLYTGKEEFNFDNYVIQKLSQDFPDQVRFSKPIPLRLINVRLNRYFHFNKNQILSVLKTLEREGRIRIVGNGAGYKILIIDDDHEKRTNR